MSQFKHKISKSRFVSGIQCSKKLYFDLYRHDLKPPISKSQELLFSSGNTIGMLARQVFAMGSSASIKSVLPAIAPELSYKDLETSNGGDASSTFIAMIEGTFNGNIEVSRNHLLDYCNRDTLGMVIIWQELYSLSGF